MCTILITALIFTLKLTNVIKFLYFGAFLFSIIVIECNETDIMALDRTYNVAWWTGLMIALLGCVSNVLRYIKITDLDKDENNDELMQIEGSSDILAIDVYF